MPQPNILFFFTDQQRFDTIAALGNSIIRTPSLDQFVRNGVAFTNAFTPNPVCMAARCSMVTGLPCHLTGVTDNTAIPTGLTSFMQELTALGYQTHGVGKMHFDPEYKQLWGFESRDISEEGPTDTDFHDFLKKNGHGHISEVHGLRGEYYYLPQPSQLPAHLHETRWVGDRSIDFLRRRDRKRPFFLWSSFIKPHPPFENPHPWSRLYRTMEMPAPFLPDGHEDLRCLWNRVQNRYKYRDAGTDLLLVRTIRAAYYSSISFIDQQIGSILSQLSDEERQNTLIVFSSDHGELLGDYGSFGKRCMLDAACRIPLLVVWPGKLKPDTQCQTPATLLDLYPTFLRAAGADNWQVSPEGTDLVALAQAKADRRKIFSQFSEKQTGLYMIMDGRWKYFYSAADEREWLLDRLSDPKETRNLAADVQYRDILNELRLECIQRFEKAAYNSAVQDGKWRRYGLRDLPEGNPDYGLLLQDQPELQAQINDLGPDYARTVTVTDDVAYRILFDLRRD